MNAIFLGSAGNNPLINNNQQIIGNFEIENIMKIGQFWKIPIIINTSFSRLRFMKDTEGTWGSVQEASMSKHAQKTLTAHIIYVSNYQ